MECGICYDTKCEKNFEILECMHSICKSCFPLIRHNLCPFCRAPLRRIPQAGEEEVDSWMEIIPVNEVRIRHRRRRRERRHETIPSVNIPTGISPRDIDNIRRELNGIMENMSGDARLGLGRRERRRWNDNARVHNSTRDAPPVRNVFI